MFRRKYTVILLPPEVDGQVRRFRLRPVYFSILATLGLLVALAGAWLGYDYYQLKTGLPEMERLRSENLSRQTELLELRRRLGDFKVEMDQLNRFNHKLKVVLGMDEGGKAESQGRYEGKGGSDPIADQPVVSLARQLEAQMASIRSELDRLNRDARLSEQIQQELQAYLESRKSVLAATPSILPTTGRLTSRYGMRRSPFNTKREFHRGLDIANRRGTKIVAPANGQVASIIRERGYGLILTINHGYGIKTRYAHLGRTKVKPGQLIKRGQLIALMGNSGRSTGSHLHYEVWRDGKPVNPAEYVID